MADKQRKRQSVSLVIEKCKLKSQGSTYTWTRIAKIKKTVNINCYQGCRTTRALMHWSGNVIWYNNFGK